VNTSVLSLKPVLRFWHGASLDSNAVEPCSQFICVVPFNSSVRKAKIGFRHPLIRGWSLRGVRIAIAGTGPT